MPDKRNARARPNDPEPLLQSLAAQPRRLAGVPVRRVLPAPSMRRVGPFVLIEHIGPASAWPGWGFDVRSRPQRGGLSMLTWLFDGVLLCRDGLGSVQRIEPGMAIWMPVGRGIVESQPAPGDLRPEGGRPDGIQVWVALPEGAEEVEPAFVRLRAGELPSIDIGGMHLVLVAGEAFGERAPAPMGCPMHLLDVRARPGDVVPLPLEHAERAVYVVEGEIELGHQRLGTAGLGILRPGAAAPINVLAPSRLLLFGGAPLSAA